MIIGLCSVLEGRAAIALRPVIRIDLIILKMKFNIIFHENSSPEQSGQARNSLITLIFQIVM